MTQFTATAITVTGKMPALEKLYKLAESQNDSNNQSLFSSPSQYWSMTHRQALPHILTPTKMKIFYIIINLMQKHNNFIKYMSNTLIWELSLFFLAQTILLVSSAMYGLACETTFIMGAPSASTNARTSLLLISEFVHNLSIHCIYLFQGLLLNLLSLCD